MHSSIQVETRSCAVEMYVVLQQAIENMEVSTFLFTNIVPFLSISPYDNIVLCG
jgi:hypothetical protein